MMRMNPLFFLTLVSVLILGGCAASGQTKGTVGGATLGGILGAVIGNKSDHEKEGAVIGAVLGGTIGNIVGRRLDEQATELKQVPGVENVSYDPQQQSIDAKLKIHFDFDKANIKPSELSKLDELANVFAKYPENVVVIEGHTDDQGADTYNQMLSEKRAAAVKNYLKTKNLDIASLNSVGYGESQPLTANGSEDGRALNRRVELKITVDPNRVPTTPTVLQ